MSKGNDTYRSVVASASPSVISGGGGGGGGFGKQFLSAHHQQQEKLFQAKLVPVSSSLSASSVVQKSAPVLPVELERFPLQPHFAILRGSFAECVNAIAKVLNAKGSGFQIKKMKRDEGRFDCVLDDDKDAFFNL